MGTLLILLLAAGVSGFAQEQELPVFRAGVADVRVDIQVVEGPRTIADLTKDDFVVYDEGAPMPVAYFGRESEPLSLLLLLDVSGSMSRFLEQMAAKSREALRRLHAGDKVGVMAFKLRSRLLQDLSDDFSETSRLLGQAVRQRGDLGSGSEINGAIIAGARYLGGSAPPSGRRAILIVTDNTGLSYQVSNEMVIRALYEADTVLNAMVVGGEGRPQPASRGGYVNPDFTPSDVFRLAGETGGEAIKADKAEDRFARMLERIRTRYSLHYHAPESTPNTPRRIRVELTARARSRHPKAAVRARTGYYAR